MSYTIGVEVAGSQIRAALLNMDVNASHPDIPASDLEHLRGTPWSEADLGNIVLDSRRQIEHIVRICKDVVEASGVPGNDIRGVGVAIIPAVERTSGRMIAVDAFQTFPVDFKMPLIARLRTEFRPDIKVDVHNRSQAGAFGEFNFGVGQTYAPTGNLVYITVSYFVNMGIIVNRELYGGSRGLAGQFSHIMVDPNGPRCSACQQRGCLWIMASGYAMAREFSEKFVKNGKGQAVIDLMQEREKMSADERYTFDRGGVATVGLPEGEVTVDGRAIIDAAQSRDAEAIEIVEQAGRYIGRGIAQVVNFMNPDVIVMGGIAARSDVLSTVAEREAKTLSLSNAWVGCSVQLSAHDDKTPILGAALLARP